MSLTGSINSKDHFVIARNKTGFYQLYGFYPDFLEDFALSNTGDLLNLTDSQGNAVDFVAWENEFPSWNINAEDTTIRRKNSLDTDTVEDWEDSHSKGDPGEGSYPSPYTTTTTTTVTTAFTTSTTTATTTTTTTKSTTSTPTTSATTSMMTTTDKSTELTTTITTSETSETSDTTSHNQTENSSSLPIVGTILALLLIKLKRK